MAELELALVVPRWIGHALCALFAASCQCYEVQALGAMHCTVKGSAVGVG